VKGKLWELAPVAIAAAIAFGYALTRWNRPPAPAAAVRSIPAARPSTGPGDPTRPGDFRPDPHSVPDPSAGPDTSVPADRTSAPDADSKPAPRAGR
jgi:hypothetical protein